MTRATSSRPDTVRGITAPSPPSQGGPMREQLAPQKIHPGRRVRPPRAQTRTAGGRQRTSVGHGQGALIGEVGAAALPPAPESPAYSRSARGRVSAVLASAVAFTVLLACATAVRAFSAPMPPDAMYVAWLVTPLAALPLVMWAGGAPLSAMPLAIVLASGHLTLLVVAARRLIPRGRGLTASSRPAR